MKEIYFISTNKGKHKELLEASKDSGIELKMQTLEIDEPQIEDMVEISRRKAKEAFEKLQIPVLTDDSGIYLDNYNNFPGVFSKHVYSGLGLDGIKKLFDDGDGAHFQCCLSYMDSTLSEPITAIGIQKGKLFHNYQGPQNEPRLAYNYVFKPEGEERYMTEIPVEERAEEYNHRIKAMKNMIEALRSHFGSL